MVSYPRPAIFACDDVVWCMPYISEYHNCEKDNKWLFFSIPLFTLSKKIFTYKSIFSNASKCSYGWDVHIWPIYNSLNQLSMHYSFLQAMILKVTFHNHCNCLHSRLEGRDFWTTRGQITPKNNKVSFQSYLVVYVFYWF